MDFRARQIRLTEQLRRGRAAGILVTHLPNVRYLCGFTGSAGVLAISLPKRGPARLAFFTDGRYTAQAAEEVKGARVVIAKGVALNEAVAWLSRAKPASALLLEAEKLSFLQVNALKKASPGISWKPASGLIERLRMIKDPDELEKLWAAVQLASSVFDPVIAEIKPGVTENAIAAQLEFMCRRLGAERMSFETLVSSGARSAMPHGRASMSAVPQRGFVILDYGVIVAGYCSDMTRTVHVGKPGNDEIKLYDVVRQAQEAGIAAVKEGVPASAVDTAARSVIERAGFGKFFTHSTGHGVGLEIHESPGLRKPSPDKKAKPELLQAGMVVTIEPGIYIPGKGGVRIEDMVHVTSTGCDVLTPTAKDMIVL